MSGFLEYEARYFHGVGWEEVCFLELVLLCLPFVGLLLVGRSVANMLTGGLDRGHRLFLCLRSSKLLAQRPWRWLHQVRPHTCISASSGAANILTTHTIASPTFLSNMRSTSVHTKTFFCIPFVVHLAFHNTIAYPLPFSSFVFLVWNLLLWSPKRNKNSDQKTKLLRKS